MKAFYMSLSKTDCIIDTLAIVKDSLCEDSKVIDYFFTIGIIEFTKKYYGSSEDFKYEW